MPDIPEARLAEIEREATPNKSKKRPNYYTTLPSEEVLALVAAYREREGLREAVKEALSPGVFGPWQTVHDPLVARTNIYAICEQYGYGATMAFVSYLWAEKCKAEGRPGEEHTPAAAGAVRKAWIKQARKALAAKGTP